MGGDCSTFGSMGSVRRKVSTLFVIKKILDAILTLCGQNRHKSLSTN